MVCRRISYVLEAYEQAVGVFYSDGISKTGIDDPNAKIFGTMVEHTL